MAETNGGFPAPNREYEYKGLVINGFAMIFFTFVLLPALIACAIILGGEDHPGITFGVSLPLFILLVLGCCGYFVQEPNEARVMIFFGKYVGTCRKTGYYWVNPFITRKKLSLRIRNMDIDPIKVNDKVGNPVLIGMVLVWRIRDTYKVVFDLDSASLGGNINSGSLDHFVRIQSDAALREVTGHFAYDQNTADANELTLRDGGDKISELLERKINDRLAMAGMEAIISAREKIVEGAVSMVEMALKRIEDNNIAKLTEERKAAMVGNLLVVLCADEPVTPMLNTTENS